MHGTIGLAQVAASERPRATRAYSMPLDHSIPADPELFRTDTFWPYFERLRKEDPVHYCKDSMFGPYWSVTKYNDIMDGRHEPPGVLVGGLSSAASRSATRPTDFGAADVHRHGPAASTTCSARPWRRSSRRRTSASWRPIIRERAGRDPRRPAERRDVRLGRPGLDRADHADARHAVRLPVGGPPQADLLVRRRDRRRRTPAALVETGASSGRPSCWSAAPTSPSCGTSGSTQPPTSDLISMLAHGEATRNMDPQEYPRQPDPADRRRQRHHAQLDLGRRLGAEPESRTSTRKLRDNPGLIASMVPEIIRWQTPLAHMRRTALEDTELGGKTIRKGDKVVMWYVSGNRDEDVIERPERLHHRPRAAAPAPLVRLRHPPLRRQPPGRAAAEDPLGGDPEALRRRSR